MASTYTIDSNGTAFTLAAAGDEGAIHIYAIEEVADLETALMTSNYPTRMVLEHVDTDDIFERGPIGGEKEIGLYIEHFVDFLDYCCTSGWETTVDASVRDRLVELFDVQTEGVEQ